MLWSSSSKGLRSSFPNALIISDKEQSHAALPGSGDTTGHVNLTGEDNTSHSQLLAWKGTEMTALEEDGWMDRRINGKRERWMNSQMERCVDFIFCKVLTAWNST